VRTLAGHQGIVQSVTFSPDGRLVAATVDPHTLGLWEATTGRELPPIHAPDQKSIQGAVFTPDGRCIALDLSGEDTLRLWEIASGKERRQYGKKPASNPNQAGGAGMMFVGGGFNGGVPMPFTRPAPGTAFSPDGKLVAQSRTGNTITIFDVATSKELCQLKGHQGNAESLTFAPDGKMLASGSRDTTGLIWDLKGIAPSAKPQAADVNVQARWNELASDDAAKAYEAILALAGAPAAAVAFLKDHVNPAATADPERVQSLIADLDSDQFALRKKATTELERIGEAATPLLRKALEADPSTEVRRRIEEVLKKTDSATPRGESLRTIRALEVLEAIATPEAKAVLQTVAKGVSEAAVTRAAQATLDRLR